MFAVENAATAFGLVAAAQPTAELTLVSKEAGLVQWQLHG